MTSVLRNIISTIARFAFKRLIKSNLHLFLQQQWRAAKDGDLESVPEITKLQGSWCGNDANTLGLRLNLLIPAISAKHVFGGIATALDFAEVMAPNFSRIRIIVTDEAFPSPASGLWYSQWPIKTLDNQGDDPFMIVSAGDRAGRKLCVDNGDVFMATAWWTAHLAFDLNNWMASQQGNKFKRKVLYLIQDFEPGFYPWSSRWLYAKDTYCNKDDTIAVVNSHQLNNYFKSQGYGWEEHYVLQPIFNPKLKRLLKNDVLRLREKIVVVYTRPSVERNAFSIAVAALRGWVERCDDVASWKFYGVGEHFNDIPLGKEIYLNSLGKLSLEDYAGLLLRSRIGLSLMCSPHPSYPPLEMAAFGVEVVTNSFDCKCAEELSPRIHSTDRVTPSALATKLMELGSKLEHGDSAVNLDVCDFTDAYPDGTLRTWPHWDSVLCAMKQHSAL